MGRQPQKPSNRILSHPQIVSSETSTKGFSLNTTHDPRNPNAFDYKTFSNELLSVDIIIALRKLKTQILDLEQAKNKSDLKLPWSMWDDIVISSQMKRLKIKEIYSNDEDLDKTHGSKVYSKTLIARA